MKKEEVRVIRRMRGEIMWLKIALRGAVRKTQEIRFDKWNLWQGERSLRTKEKIAKLLNEAKRGMHEGTERRKQKNGRWSREISTLLAPSRRTYNHPLVSFSFFPSLTFSCLTLPTLSWPIFMITILFSVLSVISNLSPYFPLSSHFCSISLYPLLN